MLIVKFGSGVTSPRFLGHLAGYLLFAITSSRVDRLCSFLNMMRILSSATSCTKGVQKRGTAEIIEDKTNIHETLSCRLLSFAKFRLSLI